MPPGDDSTRDQSPEFEPVTAESAADRPMAMPERIGNYHLLGVLGEGGFGVVYEAEQTKPVRRRVALKVIKPGMDSRAVISRFEAERQALAVMDHPCIARVLDGGATDRGLPFFAMELVRGEPITSFCDKHKHTLDERVDLFIRVCEAVQHAHMKGVIHRDLKPSNILVEYDDASGRANPKVIDFGVAKALHQRLSEHTIYTQHGQLIGTPAYMSPEQAEMSGLDVDTRSDIYSLGVVLYELLSGATPFDAETLGSASVHEIQRIIREVEPPRPSTKLSAAGDDQKRASIVSARGGTLRELRTSLRRDLDWIVMRCLEKERSRRYDTANALAMDLQRYLSDEPVLAGPPSITYKLGKFVKRNRGGILAACVGLLLLIGGLAGTSFGLIQAQRQRDRAEIAAESEAEQRQLADDRAEEAEAARVRAETAEHDAAERADELEAVVGFQNKQFAALDPTKLGAGIDREFRAFLPPEKTDAFDQATAGISTIDVARNALLDVVFMPAIWSIEDDFADQPLMQARLFDSVAGMLQRIGLPVEALYPAERAADIYTDEHGLGAGTTVDARARVANLYETLALYAEAEGIRREILEHYRTTYGAEHTNTLDSWSAYGFNLHRQDRNAEAEREFKELLKLKRRVLGDADVSTINTVAYLSNITLRQGRLDESKVYLDEAIEGYRRLIREGSLDDSATLDMIDGLAFYLSTAGETEEAVAFARQLVDGRRSLYGERHPVTLWAIDKLSTYLKQNDEFAEAEVWCRRALEGRRFVLGPNHRDTIGTLNHLSELLVAQEKHDEAIEVGRELLKARTWVALRPEATARDRNELAWELLTNEVEALHDPERALPFAEQACALEETNGGDLLWRYLDTLALAQHRTGDTESALQNQRRAVQLGPQQGETHDEMAAMLAEYEAALEQHEPD